MVDVALYVEEGGATGANKVGIEHGTGQAYATAYGVRGAGHRYRLNRFYRRYKARASI